MAKAGHQVIQEDHLAVRLLPLPFGSAAVVSHKNPVDEKPNEDAAMVWAIGEDAALIGIADGVGGSPAGRQASKLALTTLCQTIESAPESPTDLRAAVLDGIEAANHAVQQIGVGALTTMHIIALHQHDIQTCHVGDSGFLLVGGRGKIKLQTVAHSPVGYGQEAGLLSAEEAQQHPERHIVLNIVGDADMRIEVGPRTTFAPRDRLVVGSDGLFDNLSITEIIEIIRTGPLDECAARLAARCQEKMPHPDDMTFIIYARSPRSKNS